VVGALGGPVTVDWDGPYTFDDSLELAPIPMASRFYRLRIVP